MRPTLAQSSQPNNVYTTLADVRNALQIEDSLDDNDIQAAILAASVGLIYSSSTI